VGCGGGGGRGDARTWVVLEISRYRSENAVAKKC
jgi:hypothetical protein